jgi:hypothetical protein
MVVVFPAPLGPKKPKISPRSTWRSRPSMPRVAPNILVSPVVSMAPLTNYPLGDVDDMGDR